jgi:ribosomal-protein-alanine N-acetyltransferase
MQRATLKGEKVSIMRFEKHHLTTRYVAWLNDPIVVKWSEQRHRNHTLESCQSYLGSFPKNRGEIGSEFTDEFLAIISDDPKLGHIGNISTSVDKENCVADLSILIGERRAWGMGFGLETWRLLMDHLLTKLQMRKVTAGTMSANVPMLKVMDKSGMTIEGRRAEQFVLDNGTADLVYAGKFRK